MAWDLSKMFHPRGVALIGASTEVNKLSGRPFQFFQEFGYTGGIYPVNPKYTEMGGVPCYGSVADIPGPVDLAVITLPAVMVPPALEACGKKGVRAAAIISSGFAEIGAAGIGLQEDLIRIAGEYNIALCGPNCSGFVYLPERITASFSVGLNDGFPEVGPAAFISQSGALSSYILGAARQRNVRFGYWITTGNECVLGFSDYLDYILDDPDARLVLGYLEDARDGAAFRAAAQKALVQDTPLIMMKTGRSDAGAKASLSHTGSLAGSEQVYQAVFDKHAILRADNLDELFDLAVIAQYPKRPRSARVQILTISGAAGILMADVGSEWGIEFPDLTAETKAALEKVMPAFASIANPMDLTAQAVSNPELFRKASEIILADPNVDTLVLFLGIIPGAHERLAEGIAQVARATDKLVAVAWFPLPDPAVCRMVAEAQVPLFTEPARAIRSIGKMVRHVSTRRKVLAEASDPEADAAPPALPASANELIATARSQGRGTLSEQETKSLLGSWGFPVPRGGLARSIEEAQTIAASISTPVAMKISSPDILHKTEASLLRLNVSSPGEVAETFTDLIHRAEAAHPGARLDGVLVEQMVSGQVCEVVAGLRQDLRFGPFVTFGLGGVFVEAMRDVVVWPAPMTLREAGDLIRKIRGFHLLTGFRNSPPADTEALAQFIWKLGNLAVEFQETIAEIEINPLFVMPAGSGLLIGDALGVLK